MGAPSEAHRWYGVELASELVALRGIGAAVVVSHIYGELRPGCEIVLDATTPGHGSDVAIALVE
jgi:hypothetical protein